MTKIPHNPDEVLAVVDDNDKVIGKAKRKEINMKGLLHREVYVYLISGRKVLLHKRADTKVWDHSSSGHFPYSQSYEQGALREFEEELGIKLKKSDLNEIARERLEETTHKGYNNRFVHVYLVKKEIPIKDFKIDKAEIEEIRYFDRKELENLISKPEKITYSAGYFIKKYILKEL